jgi:plasmid stability protein
MPAVTIRNLPEETHRALTVRAAHHGRSTEAEMREILEAAVRPAGSNSVRSWPLSAGRLDWVTRMWRLYSTSATRARPSR